MEIYPKVGNLTARVVLRPFVLVRMVERADFECISTSCASKHGHSMQEQSFRVALYGRGRAYRRSGVRPTRPYTFPGEIGIVPMRQTHILVFRILNLLPPRRDLFGRRCGRQKKRRNENPKWNPIFIRDSESKRMYHAMSLPTPCSLA